MSLKAIKLESVLHLQGVSGHLWTLLDTICFKWCPPNYALYKGVFTILDTMDTTLLIFK